MILQQERTLIEKFVIKTKRQRYLAFLEKDSTRHKFTNELYHFKDFIWQLFREIPGAEDERKLLSSITSVNTGLVNCIIVSADSGYDQKLMPVDEAIECAVGIEGTILIFGNADIVSYEGEAPQNRYISR